MNQKSKSRYAMKKVLLIPVFAALIFFSCRKEHSAANQPQKKFPVTINVANFVQKGGHFALRRGPLNLADTISPGSYADILYYLVYDSDGRFLISKQVQDSTMTNMGMITDSLPNGTWPVYIVAGKKGLVGDSNNFQYLPAAFFGYGGYYWQDTFWYGSNITVNNAPVTQNITLKRVVTKLELDVLDAIPSNAKTISMAVYPEVATYWLNSGTPFPETMDTTYTTATIPTAAIGHTNFTLDKIIGLESSNTSVVVTCRDASNNVIARKTASNVYLSTNQRTVLSGNLFTNTAPNSQTFTVKVDTAWGGTSTISF
jgi:hypothetical protein